MGILSENTHKHDQACLCSFCVLWGIMLFVDQWNTRLPNHSRRPYAPNGLNTVPWRWRHESEEHTNRLCKTGERKLNNCRLLHSNNRHIPVFWRSRIWKPFLQQHQTVTCPLFFRRNCLESFWPLCMSFLKDELNHNICQVVNMIKINSSDCSKY